MRATPFSRRHFLQQTAAAAAGAALAATVTRLQAADAADPLAQTPGERPPRAPGVTILNPRGRVPVGLIIDDSTCLVNTNRFAMPQFNQASTYANKVYHADWKSWPHEIPDAFVRKFGEWNAEQGVKGKYSIVPYPACVGRLDRILPGWTQQELDASLDLVRKVMMPNWDIHPEMVTHTRVIDLKTGHPYPEVSPKFMENWEWSTGRSTDEIAAYLTYALSILKNVGLPCEGITTPGGFGNKARPQLAQGTLQAVRDVFGAEIPHYFRHVVSEGPGSVAPRVEYASGLAGADPRCVVSIIAGTGDWTGGWNNVEPGGVDKYITADLQSGRMVEIIQRGEPALAISHWTGIYWNGEERGFKIWQEVVRRLHARFDNLVWMKLSEVARYWAARELTKIERENNRVRFHAPFACPAFTVQLSASSAAAPRFTSAARQPTAPLSSANRVLDLKSGAFHRDGQTVTACFDLPKGVSTLEV